MSTPFSSEGLPHQSISALIPGWQGWDASKYDVGIVNDESKNKDAYIVQLNCHIYEEFSTDLERKKRHKQSGNSWMGLPIFLKRRMISPRLAAVQKLNS